jgi:hypothetical protein
MSTTPTCSWDGERWTQPDGTACNEDHCAMRGRCPHHVQHAAGINTCPRCIRRVRKDVDAIVELWIRLLVFDVVIDGIESEAMNLAGVAASPAQYAEKRQRLTARYDAQGWCDWPRLESFRDDDPHHPYAVLARAAQALEDGGWITVGPWDWNVVRAAAAIRTALDETAFAHGDEFADLAAELAACRAHLENVDHDSRTPDLGRPCPACVETHGKGPRLRKRHASHPGMKPGKRCGDTLCPICDGRADAWHCPDEPAHAWTDDEYKLRVDADYVQHAAALTADQLAQRFTIRVGTIRVWANRGLVRKRGRDQYGRQLYDVADVQERHTIGQAS